MIACLIVQGGRSGLVSMYSGLGRARSSTLCEQEEACEMSLPLIETSASGKTVGEWSFSRAHKTLGPDKQSRQVSQSQRTKPSLGMVLHNQEER